MLSMIDPADLGFRTLLAEGLKEWREKEVLTQAQAGQRLGVSGGALSAWENGRSWPRAPQREAIREQLSDIHSAVTAVDRYEQRRQYLSHHLPHTAALWTVEAKKDADNRAELGDLGGHGYLMDLLRRRLDGAFFTEVDDDAKERPAAEVRRFVDTGRDDEVACIIALHEYGVRAVVSLDTGPVDRFPWNPQTVEAMILVRATRTGQTGLLAVHFNNRSGAKVPITGELEAIFHGAGLTPRIEPAAAESAVRQALLENRVKEYRFVARLAPHERFDDDRVRGQEIGRIETRVLPKRGGFLRGGWLLSFMRGDRRAEAFDELVTFDGKQYDEAKVTVKLANGRIRTVNVLEADERVGHALTFDLVGPGDQVLPSDVSDSDLVAALHLLIDDQGQ